MIEQIEQVLWFVFGLLFAFFVLVSLLYWPEAERDIEEIKRQEKQVADDYKEFLRTGNDYHFLDKEKHQ